MTSLTRVFESGSAMTTAISLILFFSADADKQNPAPPVVPVLLLYLRIFMKKFSGHEADIPCSRKMTVDIKPVTD